MTDLYDLHMNKWCLSIATLNKRRVTIFPQTNVQPVMVSPLMASMPMKGERAELLELMGCAWPVTKKTCSSFAKKARKPSSTSAGNIKSKLLNWNLWDNIWLPPNWSLFLQTTLIAQDPWMSWIWQRPAWKTVWHEFRRRMKGDDVRWYWQEWLNYWLERLKI